MYERIFPIEGRKPVELLHDLLSDARRCDRGFEVTLGSPPFARDSGNRIVGIRLRFTPNRREQEDAVTTCPDFAPA